MKRNENEKSKTCEKKITKVTTKGKKFCCFLFCKKEKVFVSILFAFFVDVVKEDVENC